MAIHHVEAPDGTILAVDAPEGASPENITNFAMANYIASQRQQESAPEPVAPPPEPQDGDFIRGLKSYVPSIKETFGGAQVLAGKALGAEALTQSGIERIRGAQAEQKGKPTDDLTAAWDQGIGTVLTDWLPYQIGSGVGNIAETVAMAGVGSLFGGAVGGAGGIFAKSMVKKGIKEAAKDIIQDQLEKGATKEAAREAGAKYIAEMGAKELEESAAKFLATKGGRAIGANVGIGAQAVLHGMGEPTSRALQEAGMNPEQLDMGALMTAAPIHAVADFVADKILLGGLRGMNLSGLSEKSTGKLVYDVLKGAAKTGAKEVIPEDIQSAAERYGAKLPLGTADAISEYINTAGAAFAMSILPGGVGGVRTYAGRQIAPPTEAAPPVEPGVEPAAEPGVEPVTGVPPVSEAADEAERIRQMEEDRARQAGILPTEPTAEPVKTTGQETPTQEMQPLKFGDYEVPQTVYHGSNVVVTAPDLQLAGKTSGIEEEGNVFWVTPNRQSAQGFADLSGGNVINEFGFSPKNPLIIDYPVSDITSGKFAQTKIDAINQAKQAGNDAVIFRQAGLGEKLLEDEIAILDSSIISSIKPAEETHPLEDQTSSAFPQAAEAATKAGMDIVFNNEGKIDPNKSSLDWSILAKMRNVGQMLERIRDHVPLDYREIIDRIMPEVKKIPVSVNNRVTKAWAGLHSVSLLASTGEITKQNVQYARKVRSGNRVETLVHEAIHAATTANYERGIRGFDAKFAKPSKELNQLLKDIRNSSLAAKIRNTSHALDNASELMAYGLSDRNTQELLKQIKLPKNETAWTKFVSTMRKLLNLPESEESALSRLLDLTEQFIAPTPRAKGKGMAIATPSIEIESPSMSPHKSYSGGTAPNPSWGIKGFSEMTSFGRFIDDLAYKYLDKHKDMKDILKAIAAKGKEVSATWDAYMRETLYHNRVAYMAKQFLNNEVKPLAQDMVKLGITEDGLHNYLLARHAAEYNAEMNTRNPNAEDRVVDGKLVPGPMKDRGSGVHTLIADLYMGRIPKSEKSNVLAKVGELNENEKALIKDLDSMTPAHRKNLQDMAKRIDKITSRTQDITVAGGLETPETVQYWRDKYPYYVPLKRDPEELDFVSTNLGLGQGFSTRAGVGRAAVGSTKTVDNILSNIMLQRDIAITRAEKARIGRALYGMFLQNPNPGFVLPVNPNVGIVSKANELAARIASERAMLEMKQNDPSADPQSIQEMRDKIDAMQALYNRMKPEADAAQAAMIQELLDSGMIPEEYKTPEDQAKFAENMIKEPEGAFYNEKTGKVEYRTNAFLRSSKNVLAIPINGETRYLFFNPSDERAMRMINALKNNDLEKIGEFTQMVAKATRWISAVNTQYNPFFGILNMMRDVQGAQFNLSTTALKGEQMAVNRHIVPSLFAIYKSLRSERAGTELDSQYAQEWQQFQSLGGPTGYKDMIGRERDQLSVLAEEIKKLNEGEAKAVSRKAFDAIIGRMSDFNDSMENAVRLSAFIEAKKKFASKGMNATEAADKAAELAKNLTVNFNRKGQKTALVNSWYAFFNAAAQGSARLIETIRGPAGKKIMASLVLLGVMQSLLLKAAGFEDDDPPEFVREKNFVIPAGGGKYLSWPLPLGFNVFTNFGRLSSDIVTDVLYNNGRHASDKAVAMVSTLSNTFNPFGTSGLSIQTLAPSVVDPLAAIAENRDAFGRPIHRADMATKPTPGYLRSREGTSDIANFFAAALNRMSGGTEFQKGAISPTGDDIEYLAGQVGGGTWREGRKLFGLMTKPEGEETPPYKIPLYGRFVGDTGAKANISNQFYQNVTQLASYGQEIEGRVNNKQEFQSFLQDHPEARMYKSAANVYNKISDLNHTKKLLIERNAPKSQIQQVEDAKINIMKMFNERVKEAQQ